MKAKLLFIFLLFTLPLFAQKNRAKLFPFKSAIIEFKYEASFSGTHTKYIDDYGYKQADYIEKKLNFGGNTDKEYETIILIGNKAYTIDHQENEVAIGRNSTYGYYLFNKNRSCTEVAEALIKSEGYLQKGTTNFIGKECKVWQANKATRLSWNGVVLSEEINFMTMMVEKAVKIEIDVDIPESKFEIPQGFKYVSSDVYQGYSGLELQFENSETTSNKNEKSIKASFSTTDLGGCNNFEYFTNNGEKVIIEGVNDYNKIDVRLIKSQEQNMISDEVELTRAKTLLFKTNSGDFGKMQIKKLEKDDYKIRFVVFNTDGTIKTFSDGTNKMPENDFEITDVENNNKLKITPKDQSKYFVLGW